MVKPKLYILAGIPGCGKSTWAKRFFNETLIASTDAIRASLYEGDYDASRNEEVFRLFHSMVEGSLRHNKPPICVADSTALTEDSREALRDIALATGAETHLVMFHNTSQAWSQNKQRDPRWVVPDAAMDYMLRKHSRTMEALADGEMDDYDSVTYIDAVTS